MKLAAALFSAFAIAQDADPSDNLMVALKGFAPDQPSISEFFSDNNGDLRTNLCAKSKTIQSFDLNKLPASNPTEQSVIDACLGNPLCLMVIQRATEMVQCKGFEQGDASDDTETIGDRFLQSTDAALSLVEKIKVCGEEIGSAFQKIRANPNVNTFIKIPSTTDLACRGRDKSPCLAPIVQKLVDEGVPEDIINKATAAVSGTSAHADEVSGTSAQLLSIDGPLSMLGDDGHLDNVCFGPDQFAQFKSEVLQVVNSQKGDERKARLGAVFVRIAGHDLMDHDVNAGNGGSDGCILWQDLKGASVQKDDMDNAGIENAWAQLKKICPKYSISRADCLVLAAEVVITSTSKGGITFNSKVGRKDATECDFNTNGPPGTKSRLPPWHDGGGALLQDANQLLRTRLGLSWEEYVALLGVHNLGGISLKNTGIPQKMNGLSSARWKKTWKLAKQFDSGYYRGLMGEKWFECDTGAKVLLKCNSEVHGGGTAFFGIWNHNKADKGPTALGPMANKGNHVTKKNMIALSTDMAVATDIHSVKHAPGIEPCPGCSKRDGARAPKGNPTQDYKKGDPRRQATAAVIKFAKDKKAFFAKFPIAWEKVTENGHLQDHLKPFSFFAGKSCSVNTAAKPVSSGASASAVAKPAATSPGTGGKCSHNTGVKCPRGSCPRSTFGKCIKGKCLCHRSECAFNGKCAQNPNFSGQRGGFSPKLEMAAVSETSATQGHGVVALVGAAVAGGVGTLLAVAGVAMVFKRNREANVALTPAGVASI